MTSLRDILVSTTNVKCSLLTGYDGLDREVRVITSLESPKSIDQLVGGEFVLSSGVLFVEHPEELYKFIALMIEKKCVGLGIKTRFIHNISENVLKLARSNSFPIVQLPDDCLWSDFFIPFFKNNMESRNRIIDSSRFGEKALGLAHLGKISAKLLNPKFVEILLAAAVITDSDLNILASNMQPGVDVLKELLRDIDARALLLVNTSVHSDAPQLGISNFFTYKGNRILDIMLSDNQHLLLDSTSKNLSADEIELLQISYGNMLKSGDTLMGIDEMVDRILGELTQNRGLLKLDDLLGWQKFDNSQFAVFIYQGDSPDDFSALVVKLMDEQKPFQSTQFFYHKLEGAKEYLGLCITAGKCREETDWISRMSKALYDIELDKTQHYIYFGNPVTFAGDISASRDQAFKCRMLEKTLWESSHVGFYKQIDCLAALMELDIDLEEIGLLQKSVPGFDACETLEAYLEHKNIKKAADAIFIHENTMRYRITKIQRVLQMNLHSQHVSLNLLLKIKLFRILHSDRGRNAQE